MTDIWGPCGQGRSSSWRQQTICLGPRLRRANPPMLSPRPCPHSLSGPCSLGHCPLALNHPTIRCWTISDSPCSQRPEKLLKAASPASLPHPLTSEKSEVEASVHTPPLPAASFPTGPAWCDAPLLLGT